MNESELVRLQIEAAMEYVNRIRTWTKIDVKSCKTLAKLVKGDLVETPKVESKRRVKPTEDGTI